MRHANPAPLTALLTLPLLLTACPQPQAPGQEDIPTVARTTRPGVPACRLAGTPGTPVPQSALTPMQALAGMPGWVQDLGGPQNVRDVNLRPRTTAQAIDPAADTLYNLLYDTRVILNGNYWGHSTVDLQALHERYEASFKTTFGTFTQAPPPGTDALMNEYVNGVQDGHTYYLTAAQYRAHQDALSGTPTPTPRFGFAWAPVPQENGAVLTDVRVGTPADEAGLRRGDVILSVNGQPLTRAGSEEDTWREQQAILASAAGTGQPVTLAVRRAGSALTLSVTPRIISSGALPRGAMLDARTYLLRVPTFATKGVAERVHTLIREAQTQGATRLILDLRDNGGGLLTEEVAIAAAFAPTLAGQTIEDLSGQDVTFGFRAGRVLAGVNCTLTTPYLALTAPTEWTGQTAVLLNGGSASASEITALTLQQDGATLIGEPTYGVANTVTIIDRLPGARGLAVTIGISRDLTGTYLPARATPPTTTPDDLRALAHGTDLPLQAALAALP